MFCYPRFSALVCSLAGQLSAVVCVCGCGAAGCLHCPAQPPGLGPREAGLPVGPRGPQPDCLLFHHRPDTAGNTHTHVFKRTHTT